MKHSRTLLYIFTFFLVHSRFFVGSAHAQAPSCTFRTEIKIYKNNRDTENNIVTTADFDKKLTVVNDKGQPLEIKTGSQYTYDLTIPNLKIGKENGGVYEVDAPATVKLYGLIDSGWKVKSQFCDQHSSISGCPLSSLVNTKPSKKIQGFRVNCGVDITYGWVIEKSEEKKDQPPAPQPSSSPSGPLQCSRVCIYTEADGLCHRGACPADAPNCGIGINNGCKYAGAGLCGINANGFKCDDIQPPGVTPAVITEQDELAIFVENTSSKFKSAKLKITNCDLEGGGTCERTVTFKGKGTQKVSLKTTTNFVTSISITSITDSSGGIRAQAQKLSNAISLVTDCNGNKGQVNDAGSENETCTTNPPGVVRFKILDRNAPTPTPAPPSPVDREGAIEIKPGCKVGPPGNKCSLENIGRFFGDKGESVVRQFASICWRESRGVETTVNRSCLGTSRNCQPGEQLRHPPQCITHEFSVGLFQHNLILNTPEIIDNWPNPNRKVGVEPGCILTKPEDQITKVVQFKEGEFNASFARKRFDAEGFTPWNGERKACK